MATARRNAELMASLQRELAAAVARHPFDATQRRRWLIGELRNQLDRWLAFAALESIPVKSLLNDDLFATITAVTDLFDAEAKDLSPSSARAWTNFRQAFAAASRTRQRTAFAELDRTLSEVEASL